VNKRKCKENNKQKKKEEKAKEYQVKYEHIDALLTQFGTAGDGDDDNSIADQRQRHQQRDCSQMHDDWQCPVCSEPV